LIGAASAGIIPALVAAVALVVSGCGGSDDSSSATTATVEQGSKPSPDAASGEAGGSSSDEASGQAGSQANGTGQGSGDSFEDAGSSSHKQGPRVSVPKGAPEPGIAPEQRSEATVVSISLDSPALRPVSGGVARLPAAYTCDGSNTWPELKWHGLPAGTEELALFAMSLEPVDGKIFFDWAVAGVDPDRTGLEPERLPEGAVMGRNSFGDVGYSICPAGSEGETYYFALYALSEKISPKKGFDPSALREAVKGVSSDAGLMAASYTRG